VHRLTKINAENPEPAAIADAAELIRSGRLVAFPTETVYGLGADALNEPAVRRIFAAKGRPTTNPLIVHLASIDMAQEVVATWPDSADRLAARFWPGPLTLVLPKHPCVPDKVTAGGPTVAVRMPAHPVARALIQAAGTPVAAPSANRSSALSPTTAQHVIASLGDAVDLVLDAGPCPGGIESTVLDLTADPPQILRPGLITADQIRDVIGAVVVDRSPGEPSRSPGLLPRHYAPRTPLELAPGDGSIRVRELAETGVRVAWLTWDHVPPVAGVEVVSMPRDPNAYAARLYAELHRLDAANLDRIIVAEPPDEPAWLAIRDRLRRAASN